MGAYLAPLAPPPVRAAQLSAAIPLHPAGRAVRLRRCSPAPVRDPERRPWSRHSPSSPSPWDKSLCCALQPSPQGAHLHGGVSEEQLHPWVNTATLTQPPAAPSEQQLRRVCGGSVTAALGPKSAPGP